MIFSLLHQTLHYLDYSGGLQDSALLFLTPLLLHRLLRPLLPHYYSFLGHFRQSTLLPLPLPLHLFHPLLNQEPLRLLLIQGQVRCPPLPLLTHHYFQFLQHPLLHYWMSLDRINETNWHHFNFSQSNSLLIVYLTSIDRLKVAQIPPLVTHFKLNLKALNGSHVPWMPHLKNQFSKACQTKISIYSTLIEQCCDQFFDEFFSV